MSGYQDEEIYRLNSAAFSLCFEVEGGISLFFSSSPLLVSKLGLLFVACYCLTDLEASTHSQMFCSS